MIIISAFSKGTHTGLPSPKNYPYWVELIDLIGKDKIIQVKTKQEVSLVDNVFEDLPFSALKKLLDACKSWIAVDNFFQHFAHYYGRPGNVIWGQSDPVLFGYKENNNIYKDASCFRKNQFWLWAQTKNDPSVFLPADQVLKKLKL